MWYGVTMTDTPVVKPAITTPTVALADNTVYSDSDWTAVSTAIVQAKLQILELEREIDRLKQVIGATRDLRNRMVRSDPRSAVALAKHLARIGVLIGRSMVATIRSGRP
jgi:hypothetical protein